MADFIPVSAPHLWGRELDYVAEALAGGWLSGLGPFVTRLEASAARYVGAAHALAVSNGTVALHLALHALGIGPGDEVIVPDFSIISPAFAAMYCGAVPVPVDADETWNIDPDLVERRITPRTRAIVAVHTYGHPARMSRILEIARRHGIAVVEDAAEALGTTGEGRRVGSWGDVSCFSFYANKVVTSGEGGLVATSDRALHDRARRARNLCFGEDEETRFVHEGLGFNYRMSNVQAAIAVAQFERVDEAVARKVAIGRRYNEALASIPGLTLPPVSSWADNMYWVYGIIVGPGFGPDRAATQARLRRAGIETRRFFTPLHRQPVMRGAFDPRGFPRSTVLSDGGFYVPSSIGMDPATVDRVADALWTIHRESAG